ncbi:MAG TPA: nitrate/nitrite two-component sensor NARX, partial [Rhodocyclaceae bacterium]|nr:nitrate/nitrite two-component sensor NARX [Rhodocyclaceae bacterium]
MSVAWLRRCGARLESRAILLLLVSALLAVGLIGVVGMSASVLVAEGVQGSGSAINVAGSLRRFAHRAGAMAAAKSALTRPGSTT